MISRKLGLPSLRALLIVSMVFVFCAITRPASAQTIPYAQTLCQGCTTQTQLTTQATAFFKQYLMNPSTPPPYTAVPGYTGQIFSPTGANRSCTQGQNTATTVMVAGSTIAGTYYGCFVASGKGAPYATAMLITTSTDPCFAANNLASVPCVTGITNNVNFFGTPAPGASLPSFTPLSWGTTAALIQTNFPANIEYDFQSNASLNTMITGLQPAMLARLSTELYNLDHSGYTALILAYAAEKLTAANLRLLQSAFGPTLIQNALGYAPVAVQQAYNALPVSAALFSSQYYIASGHAAPPADAAYIYDVFLEQYLSTTDSVNIALHKANLYIQVRMHGYAERVIALVASIFGIASFFDINWTTVDDSMSYYQGIALDRVTVVSIPNPTITWPNPDPDMPTFPPIDSPPGDVCYQPYDGVEIDCG